MEAKTSSRFFPELPLIIKDSTETSPLFFTLHLPKDSNIKQISFYPSSYSINYISKYYNNSVIYLKYICNRHNLLLQPE